MMQKFGKKKLVFPFFQYIITCVWCEHCSTADHPIEMQEIDGLRWKCPLCKRAVMVLSSIKTDVGTHYATDCPTCQKLEKKGIVFGKVK